MRGYHLKIALHRNSHTPAPNSNFIPTSLFQHLPSHPPKPTTTGRQSHFSWAHKDYRFGPIRIDWVDFEGEMSTAASHGKEKRGPASAAFAPHTRRSKSGSTNLAEGTVHIFRESSTRSTEDYLQDATASTEVDELPSSDDIMLGVLAVPSWMTPSDFLAFVAPAADGIAHLRIIRDSAPNRSMVVIKFFKATDASEFAEAFNGKPFNSTEPEICNVVRVLTVSIETDDTVSAAISRLGSAQGTVYELPTCPVCLERMDSAVTGLITVPCSHTFHCMCLSKWGDSRCPVCRYSQTLASSHPSSSSSTARAIPFANSGTFNLSACSDCASSNDLWICLICGNLGCGRYGRAHAHAHYNATTHLYALELETQRVWDYAGDGYVHRLIQNKADGKLVELPSAAASMGASRDSAGMGGPGPADALSAEKIEAIGIEYSYLLTSQLDSQRSFYEEQGAELKDQVAQLRLMMERLGKDFEEEKMSARDAAERKRVEMDARIVEAEKDKVRAEKRAEKMAELARKFEKDLREERAVTEGLMENLGKMKERVKDADKDKEVFTTQIADLEDQVRDVMFFLEAKTKIEQGGGAESEAAGGSVELPPPPASVKKKKGKKG